MTDDDGRVCVGCGEREAVQNSFLCLVCLPEPEREPEPLPVQPSLWEAAAA